MSEAVLPKLGGQHRAYRGASDEWYTPPELIEALLMCGPRPWAFDLDPCAPAPENRKHSYADRCYSLLEDGFTQRWDGNVWLNPPYGPEVGKWLKKLADHGEGIALIFARTETDWFQKQVFERASGVLFLRGRLHFYDKNWQRAKFNAGAPSALVAYGEFFSEVLAEAVDAKRIPGRFVRL